jgi:hypothetical protein
VRGHGAIDRAARDDTTDCATNNTKRAVTDNARPGDGAGHTPDDFARRRI